ncbi:MAG: acyltransferase [Pseudomonadota bacterium]
MGKLKSIQSLRAVAAIMVLLCHLFAMEEVHAGRSAKLTTFWVNGAHGVDLFFVISGFVIVWVASDAQRGVRGAGDFLFARVTRIYPLWWLFAGATALMVFMADGVPWEAKRVAEYGMHGPTHLAESLLLLPQAHHPILGVGWTLVHEMYFYAGFAALIFALPAKRRIASIWVWGALVMIGSTLGLTAEFADTFVRLVFHPMTLQFIAGAGVAYIIKAKHRRFARSSLVIGLVGWVAVYIYIDPQILSTMAAQAGIEIGQFATSSWQRTLFYGLPSALLVYGLVALELQGQFNARIPNPLVRIGDWSYALYLCHVPVISTVRWLVYRPFGSDNPSVVAVYLLLGVIIPLIVAALAYYLFERPIIVFFKRYRTKPSTQQPRPVAASA